MSEILLGSILFTFIVVILALIILGVRKVLLPTKLVIVTVNEKKTLPSMTGRKLLDILKDGGVPVPSACAGAGTCGLCRVTIVSGGGDILPIERTSLSPNEIGKGMRLACQLTLRNPISVRVPEEIFGVEEWQCTLRSTRSLSPLIKEIVLNLPKSANVNFRAGAFVQITAPPYKLSFNEIDIAPKFAAEWEHLQLRKLITQSNQSVTRAYSIANRPTDKGVIILNIRLAIPPPEANDIPPGIVSSWLFSLQEKDVVEVTGPYGDFGAKKSKREMIFIGGGVGIAPLRAIIYDQLERLGTKRKISFWYGARSRQDILYAKEFDYLAKEYDNFDWIVALSEPRPQDKWEGSIGFIHDVIYQQYIKGHPAPEDCEYYLCGPPLMIETVLLMLKEAGVENDNIMNDDFGG